MEVSEKIKKEIFAVLEEITNHLMINASLVFFSGLLHGKLGISLYFFHYWRYTGNPLFFEYARHLVDLVKLQINDDYPLDYEYGIVGVGTGFDYLRKYGYYDAGNDLIQQIDTKIKKALSYESRVGLLIGFGRYLLSRYEYNATLKDYIIKIVDPILHSSEQTHNIKNDTFSFLYELYLLDIEKEKIESYLLTSVDMFINDVQKEPMSWKLFTLIKFSLHPLNKNCSIVVHDLLQNIITQKRTNFTNINDLQWLLHCEQLLNNSEYQFFLPEINRKIAKNVSSFYLAKLDNLFSENKNFAFEGGYAGLGLALLSVLTPDYISCSKLLNL